MDQNAEATEVSWQNRQASRYSIRGKPTVWVIRSKVAEFDASRSPAGATLGVRFFSAMGAGAVPSVVTRAKGDSRAAKSG